MAEGLSHYGTPRHSGRYPWGSGDDPQRNRSFLQEVDELKKKGLTEKEIADGMKMTTSQLRAKKSIAKAEQRKADVAEALRLKDKGCSNVEIGKRMGLNESSVRALLNPAIQERSEITNSTAEMLKESVEKKGYIDVGVGVEKHIGISRVKLQTSIAMLKEEGYTVHYIPVEQLGTGKKTTVMVLAKPDVTYSEVYKNKDQIRMITDYSEDGGRSFLGLEPIRSVDSKRVQIRYGNEGGSDKDGVIELRRGLDDISLGNAKYAQVRVGVDGTHYLKGMAMYSDKMPKGVDIIYNTNKPTGTPKEKVFKPMKDDPDNPFGATVRQKHYIDSNGKTQLSSLNVVNEEGDWGKWSKTLSSQMLSKQSPSLAKKQLGLAYDIKKEEYDEIMRLTNPAVKKRLLDSFADDCDSAAVHLKSAALPRQAAHVILPIEGMKETEIYAPNYRDGESVVLVRYPHGGIFEIPQLTVNNRHAGANKVIRNAKDAVGINSKVAERLSGADFDGDTVLVIPNNKGLIKTSSPLKGLMNFDPKIAYPGYEGMPKISSRTKQMKMGDVSNLITDMTIRGANSDELARAVRHSMVVIDSEKHNLNYKQSYIDNGIAALKKKYQGSEKSGAATLISKASSETRVGVRKETIDKKTGKKIYEYTNETYTDSKGKTHLRTTTSTKMAEASNAFDLSSGTPMEAVYANHANKLKSLANQARKTSVTTNYAPYSPSAKKTYASEVSSLIAKLNVALKNKPLERQAQLLANSVVAMKKANNPNLDAADLKKIKGQALAEARTRTNAKKQQIDITDKEWEAIQAGAISANTLTQILNNTDLDKVKRLATPRTSLTLTAAKRDKAKLMISSGYTQAEVADALGISTSTVAKIMEEL
jgi:DNA-binding CsgD family transcriptional regulator